MRISHLILHNYRNYQRLDIAFHQNLNIFWGDNAQGKTNVIEAIYYAAMGHSHRSNTDGELIRWDEPQAGIQIDFERMRVANRLAFAFFRERPKRIVYNGQAIRPRDLIGAINAVLFSPEDLFLIKGAPAGRRRFLDLELSQADPAYYRCLTQYNRIVAQRNALLKKIRERRAAVALLDGWDEQLAQAAAAVVEKRFIAVKKLNMLANLMHRRISNNSENLEVSYEIAGGENPVSQACVSWYNSKLKEYRDSDILRGSTGVGPHRDDLALKVNRIDLRSFGSQGQQRTGALALKLSELEFIKSETGEYPVLLLDDVMSELDARRRGQLLLFIKERIQTFITATDRSYFPEGGFGQYYRVSGGQIME